MQIKAYLYDANGNDEEISPDDIDIESLNEDQLLWVNVLERSGETIEQVAATLGLEKRLFRPVDENKHRRPQLEKFENFYRFRVDSVEMSEGERPKKLAIDFVVGTNFIVTFHDGEIDYFVEFRTREKGETQLGELDAESFLATLLDLHIVSYFKAMEEIERRVDKFDETVLKTEIETHDFLAQMVGLRSDVSKLRRWLLPHRDLFYSLSRADFQQIAESNSAEEYKRLNEHFENAVDAIEHARETVLSIFDLYATKSAQTMNALIQRLTFLTLVTGTLSVLAGILGMNYKVDFFESSYGFWLTVSGMVMIAVSLTLVARFRRWI